MTKFKAYKYLLVSIAAISVLFRYTYGDKEKDVFISIYGPYYNVKILEFNLPTSTLPQRTIPLLISTQPSYPPTIKKT